MTDDSRNPFASEDDLNLASWLLWSKVAKWQIDRDFAEGLGGIDSRSFWSANTRRQHVTILFSPCDTCSG